MSDRSRPRPRYIQVEETLHTLLESGGYRAGDKLPPEPALAQQLGVSRATLREALRSFEQQGIISRRQGVGTFVNARPLTIDSGLETLESIEMLLRNRGHPPRVVERGVRTERALPKAARRLAVPEGTALAVINSTYAVDQQVVSYLLEAAPLATVNDIDLTSPCSLLELLLGRREHNGLDHAVAYIAPVHGSGEICRALGVGEETPLFFVEQTVFTGVQRPLYYSRNYYLPSVFNFHLIRRLRET